MSCKGRVVTRIILCLSLLVICGCFSRSEIVRMKGQLDYLESSNQRLEAQLTALDSLYRSQLAEIQKMRAGINNSNRDLASRLEELNSKVSDQADRLSLLTQKVEKPQPRSVVAPRDTTIIIDTGQVPVLPTEHDTVRPSGPEINAQELYDNAYKDYRRQNYDLAIAGFQEYLDYFPTSATAPDAQYWLAECYNKKQDYSKAIEEFSKVVDRFPKSLKSPQALYKIGLAWETQGNTEEARKAYQDLVTRYPASDAAKFAKEKLEKLQPVSTPKSRQ